MTTLRQRIAATFAPEPPVRRAYPRLDVLVMAVAIAGAIGLAGADFFMRYAARNVVELTDIDGQKNLTTWFQSSILLGASGCAFLIALTFAGWRRRAQWAILGSGLAFFSLDKSISLHEQVGRGLVHAFSLSDSASRVAWELAWSPIIFATAAVLILCVWETNRATKLWALGMLAGGGIKLVMEALMFPAIRFLGASEHGVFYGLEVEMEESIQLIGFACLFAGLAQLFTDRVFALAQAPCAPAEAPAQPEAAARHPVPIRRVR